MLVCSVSTFVVIAIETTTWALNCKCIVFCTFFGDLFNKMLNTLHSWQLASLLMGVHRWSEMQDCLACWKPFSCQVTYLHNGFAVSHSKSQSQTMCFKTRQLVSDATLRKTIQASMCLSIAGVLHVCTYPAWRCSADQGWRPHPHGWYCATWRVALTCGCIHCSIETEVHCKQCMFGISDNFPRGAKAGDFCRHNVDLPQLTIGIISIWLCASSW